MSDDTYGVLAARWESLRADINLLAPANRSQLFGEIEVSARESQPFEGVRVMSLDELRVEMGAGDRWFDPRRPGSPSLERLRQTLDEWRDAGFGVAVYRLIDNEGGRLKALTFGGPGAFLSGSMPPRTGDYGFGGSLTLEAICLPKPP